MGIFRFNSRADIDAGVEEFRNTSGALLVDVRSPAEYRQAHIPGSINLPLQSLQDAWELAGDPDTPLYLYCRSGARSSQAAAILGAMGYNNVRNIGGIGSYSGETESLQ